MANVEHKAILLQKLRAFRNIMGSVLLLCRGVPVNRTSLCVQNTKDVVCTCWTSRENIILSGKCISCKIAFKTEK